MNEEKKIDVNLILLEEDDLQEIIETRAQQDVESDSYKNLTEACDKREKALAGTYKVMYEHEEELRKQDIDKELKEAELAQKEKLQVEEIELKKKQFEAEAELRKAELDMKKQQFEEEMKMRQAELDQKEQFQKEDLEQREAQHNKEMKQRIVGEVIKGVFVFAGAIVTGLITSKLQSDLQQANFDNQAKWIPELMDFEVNNRFSYPFAQALERQINKV